MSMYGAACAVAATPRASTSVSRQLHLERRGMRDVVTRLGWLMRRLPRSRQTDRQRAAWWSRAGQGGSGDATVRKRGLAPRRQLLEGKRRPALLVGDGRVEVT